MAQFTTLTSRLVALPVNNVDTDQIIPARYLKVTDKAGLGAALFSDWRYSADGSPKPDFVLNQPQTQGAAILLAGDNFGCGSSREHAPWALDEYGFRVIIAPSFADIFSNNCFKNGMLPIVLDEAQVAEIMRRAAENDGYRLTIDLEQQTVNDELDLALMFSVSKFQKYCLLNGLDDIGLTLQYEDQIGSFEQSRKSWL